MKTAKAHGKLKSFLDSFEIEEDRRFCRGDYGLPNESLSQDKIDEIRQKCRDYRLSIESQ